MQEIHSSRLSLSWKIGLALGAVYLIWGSTYLAIRFAIETLPPYLMSGARFLTAGLLLYAWARLKGAPAPTLRHWRSAAVIGGLLLLGGNGSVVWAEQHVPSGIAALIVATVPLWMVLLDWLWHKGGRPGQGVIFGVLLGFGGIALLIAQGEGAHSQAIHPIGAAALLFATLSWATGSLYSRKAQLPTSPPLSVAMEMLMGGALLALAGLAGGEWARLNLAGVSLISFLSWSHLTVFGSLVGFTCYIWLLRVAPAARVATYAYVNPIVAVFLGWSIAGEVISTQTFLASAVIISAVILIIGQKQNKPAVHREEAATPDAGVCSAES